MSRMRLFTFLLSRSLPGRLGRLRRHFDVIGRRLRTDVARAIGMAVAGTVRDAVGGLLGRSLNSAALRRRDPAQSRAPTLLPDLPDDELWEQWYRSRR